MATKKTKTTSDTNTDGTATEQSGAEVVKANSNEGSTDAVTVASDLKAGATSSQDPASATGEEQPGGTNTEGDDAGATGAKVAQEIPEPVLTANEAAANPEAAAPASGTLSSAELFLSTGVMSPDGVTFNGVFLSREEIADIVAQAVKDAVAARQPADVEVRSFELLKGVILHNKIVDAEIVELTQTEHAMLVEQGAVFPDWDEDALEVDA